MHETLDCNVYNSNNIEDIYKSGSKLRRKALTINALLNTVLNVTLLATTTTWPVRRLPLTTQDTLIDLPLLDPVPLVLNRLFELLVAHRVVEFNSRF